MPDSLRESVEGFSRPVDRAPEVTDIIGGAIEVSLSAADALDLVAVGEQHCAGFSVMVDAAAVRVRFDPTLRWETPQPFTGAYWPADVATAVACPLTVNELCRRAAGATRVVRFSGSCTVNGGVVGRIMASPNVVDVRFRPGRFDVLLAREVPTIGGLAHLVASRKIQRRRRVPRSRYARLEQAMTSTTTEQRVPVAALQ